MANINPNANDDGASTGKNIKTTIDVLANDTDSDGTLDATTVTMVDGPDHGSLSINATTGKITYTPTKDYVGSDSFTYTVKDDDGMVSGEATVTIGVASKLTLTSANEAFAADAVATGPVEVDGGGGDDYLSGSSNPATAGADRFYGGEGNDIIFGAGGDDYLEGNSGDDYLRSGSGNDMLVGGAGTDTYGIRIFANKTSSTLDTGTVTIVDDDGVLWNGAPRPTTVPAEWSSQPPAAAGYQITGTATIVSAGVWDLAVADDNGGTKHLALTRDGADLKIVGGNETVTIKDYVSGKFGITLAGENTAPNANDDGASTGKNIKTTIDVLANDTDSDGTLDATTVTMVDGPDHGSLSINATTGKITYTPTKDYVGSDSFTYTVKDDDGMVSGEATVTIGVASKLTLTSANEAFAADAVATGPVEVDGGGGDDYLSGSSNPATAGADRFYGGEGNDIIFGAGGDDYLEGNSGDDYLRSGSGNDMLVGGAGTDTYGIRIFANKTSSTLDTGTVTIVDDDGVLWNGAPRPTTVPAEWSSQPPAAAGYQITGTATIVSAGVWDLAVADDNGGTKHLALTRDGADLKIVGGNETVTIKDYVSGKFGITLAGEGANTAPEINSNGAGGTAMISIAENTTAVTTVTATDADANTTITYSISAGADKNLFQIDATTGVLSFKSAPDFEAPKDSGGDNIYDVTVRATDNAGASDEQGIAVSVTDAANENRAPTKPVLSANSVAENSSTGTVIGVLSATDADGDTLTYALINNAGGKFALNTTGSGASAVTSLVVNGAMDYEAAMSHQITVQVSDGKGGQDVQTFSIGVTDVEDPAGTITIDASGSAAAGMSFESFIRGGFIAGTTHSGFPVFDNGGAFAGREMLIGYGTASSSKYVLMDGNFGYDLSTHMISGTGGAIQYGTRGAGSFDANGQFVGGNAVLKITGLAFSDLVLTSAQAGQIHNFAVAHMDGGPGDAAALAKYADVLDTYAQNFVGSLGNDVYAGTRFNDTITGNGGNDVFDGGAGSDLIVFGGAKAGYVIAASTSGTVTITNSANGAISTLTNIERARFSDQTVQLTGQSNLTLSLSASAVRENAENDTVIGTFSATGANGQPYTLTLTNNAGGKFKLVTANGVTQLVLAGALDYETATRHPVTVEIRDSLGAVTTQSFTIDVLDVDEGNAPGIDLSSSSIAEDAGIGAVVGRLSLPDADADDVTWSLSGGAGKFALETNAKGVTRLVVDGKLDYETRTSFDITLTATDGEETTEQSFTIDITDVAEVVRGSSGDDTLKGDSTPDVLKGGAGDDRLIGGGGADRLTGGAGADTFVFTAIGHSTPDSFDVITDFKGRKGDIIDLSGIDADTGRSGNQSFDFIGRDDFTGTAGELRFEKSNGRTVIQGDVDGDGNADFVLHLLGILNVKEDFLSL